MNVKILTLTALMLLTASTLVFGNDYVNVYGNALQPCSSEGMALTGYTRTGYCVDRNDDEGSHHICIDLSSANGGNFCDVTGQDDWYSSEMPCDGDTDSYCQVQQWCVCQWAFASYLSNAGGCDIIQDIVCESINIQAVRAYQGNSKYSEALECLADRCGLDMSRSYLQSNGNTSQNAAVAWLATALLLVAIGVFVALKKGLPKKETLLPQSENARIGIQESTGKLV